MTEEILILRKDVDRLSLIFDRIDATIDKLSEVSNGINRMLAVHETRLKQQEDLTQHIFTLIESRNTEVNKKLEASQERTERLRSEIREEIKEHMQTIEGKIDALSTSVASIDKWKYLVIGGSMVTGFIIAELNSFVRLFSN